MPELLAALVLPIFLSAAAVFITSTIFWMAVGHHAKDHKVMPREEGFIDYVRGLNLPSGTYGFPGREAPEGGHRSKEEFMKRCQEGPAGLLTVLPKFGGSLMGRNMTLTFVVYLAVAAVMGYIGAIALHRGDSFGKVFQLMGTCGVLAYAFSHLPHGIWYAQNGRAMVTAVIDGVVMGLVGGAVFALMWPK